MTETEIKLRWFSERGDARRYIESRGYLALGPRTLEIDQLYDRPAGELRQSDCILRLRQAGTHATVTYKGPASRDGYKSREEIEFEVSDAGALELVLERLGYQPSFRYEKFRTKFSRPTFSQETSHQPTSAGPTELANTGIIALDETPIGTFLELEGAKDWIDETAVNLGFRKDDYLTVSYGSLYREYAAANRNAGWNMTFAQVKE